MRFFLLLLTLLPAVTQAQVSGVRRAQETTSTGTATRANPTADSFTITAGTVIGASVELFQCTGFRVMVCANGGTLSGAGTLQAFLLDGSNLARNPGLDQTITVTSTSCQGSACVCQVFPDQTTEASRLGGRVLYAPNGVTSSGSGVTVYLIAATGNY